VRGGARSQRVVRKACLHRLSRTERCICEHVHELNYKSSSAECHCDDVVVFTGAHRTAYGYWRSMHFSHHCHHIAKTTVAM